MLSTASQRVTIGTASHELYCSARIEHSPVKLWIRLPSHQKFCVAMEKISAKVLILAGDLAAKMKESFTENSNFRLEQPCVTCSEYELCSAHMRRKILLAPLPAHWMLLSEPQADRRLTAASCALSPQKTCWHVHPRVILERVSEPYPSFLSIFPDPA